MSNVFIFQDMNSDADGYIEIEEDIFHKILDADTKYLYYTTEGDVPEKLFHPCIINDDVIQYQLDPSVWCSRDLDEHASNRVWGYCIKDRYYMRRASCTAHPENFKDIKLDFKRRRIAL